jgi:glutaredoxin
VIRLAIYTKPGCHLCEEMKGIVQRVLRGHHESSLEEIDISSDAALLERFGVEVPVLMVDGRKVAKYRITEAELTRKLESRRHEGGEGHEE